MGSYLTLLLDLAPARVCCRRPATISGFWSTVNEHETAIYHYQIWHRVHIYNYIAGGGYSSLIMISPTQMSLHHVPVLCVVIGVSNRQWFWTQTVCAGMKVHACRSVFKTSSSMLELWWDMYIGMERVKAGSTYTYITAAGDIRPLQCYNILHASTKGGKLYH